MSSLTSSQPLGDAKVMVCYEHGPNGVEIEGVDLCSGFVEADLFADKVVARWAADIAEEVRKEAEDAQECAAYYAEWSAL